MAHFSTTFAMAGSGDTTRFSSLEFPALPLVGMRVPPIFEPSQAFLFRSLDFIADRLGILHLREEASLLKSSCIPESMEGAPPMGVRMRASSRRCSMSSRSVTKSRLLKRKS